MKILRIVDNKTHGRVVVLTEEHGRTVLQDASIFDFSTEAKLISAVEAKMKEKAE